MSSSQGGGSSSDFDPYATLHSYPDFNSNLFSSYYADSHHNNRFPPVYPRQDLSEPRLHEPTPLQAQPSSNPQFESSVEMETEPEPTPEPEPDFLAIDFHALEYVGTYDENLDCPICRVPLVEPRITSCFHVFCRECLNLTISSTSRRECPIDRIPLSFFPAQNDEDSSSLTHSAPPIITNQLDNLQVRCPNARCDHVCARSSIAHHYRIDCPFTKVPCPDANCTKLVTRGESEEGGCLHKNTDCVYCGKIVELADLNDHYDNDCIETKLACEHCHAEIQRPQHAAHVNNCDERMLECKFKTSGCSYKEKKKSFGDHERTCLYGMIMRMNNDHRRDIANLESILADSQDRVHKLEQELDSCKNVNVNVADSDPQPSSNPGVRNPAMVRRTAAALPPPPLADPTSSGRAPVFDEALPVPYPDFEVPLEMSPNMRPLATNNNHNNNINNPLSDDNMNHLLAYIDLFDAKVENVERYMGEIDARHTQMLMNEVGPLNNQMIEMRNNMGHMTMYVRWLMQSVRQNTKRAAGLSSVGTMSSNNIVGGGASAASANTANANAATSANSNSANSNAANANATNAAERAAILGDMFSSNGPLRHPRGSVRNGGRRLSGGNPPRL